MPNGPSGNPLAGRPVPFRKPGARRRGSSGSRRPAGGPLTAVRGSALSGRAGV